MKTATPTEVAYLSPLVLTFHAGLEDFPELPADQMDALTESVKEKGILEPLFCTPDNECYGGRAKLRIAQALDIPEVPVIIREETDVLGYAIETAVARRQLSKSGIALVIFEQHPELAATKGAKAGRPKTVIPHNNTSVSPSKSGEVLAKRHESFRQLGARYKVPHYYFSLLGEMRDGMTGEEWTELRRVILEEEASIPRQFAGYKTGRPAGSSRGPVVYAFLSEQGLLEGILPRAFSSLREGFSRWDTEIDSKSKAAVEKEWGELLDAAPPELLRIAKRKAAAS